MSTKPEVRAEASSENQIEERLQTLAEMVVYGASRHEVVQFAEKVWRVSRRTAQEYLKRVQERLLRDDVAQNRAFCLTLSQMQRDKLVGLALRYAHENRERLDPRVMQSLASLMTAVRGLLDSRDRAAGEIHALVAEQLREAEAVAQAGQVGQASTQADRSAVGSPTPKASAWGNGNGQTHRAERTTPLSAGVSSGSGPRIMPIPKPNGRREMGPTGDKTGVPAPPCADCASPGLDEGTPAGVLAGS